MFIDSALRLLLIISYNNLKKTKDEMTVKELMIEIGLKILVTNKTLFL